MKKYIVLIIAYTIRIILFPIIFSIVYIVWMTIGIFKPKGLGKILIKTGENLLK